MSNPISNPNSIPNSFNPMFNYQFSNDELIALRARLQANQLFERLESAASTAKLINTINQILASREGNK